MTHRYIGRYPADGPHEEEEHEYTRDELVDRLEGWQQDPEAFVASLEADPGFELRGSAFAWYRAEAIEAEPCIHCGAPILGNAGHDPGCSYEKEKNS